MTTPTPPTRPRKQLEPIDPNSEHGRRVALALGELFDEIAEGLRRDGELVPDCISPPADKPIPKGAQKGRRRTRS
ncbi:MAG: hypothetical protein QOJ48_435 [Frankiales bacterium]|jgi:hypothetical protein|nr:hypothetical protein [Frankiales bacterium]